MLRKGMYIGELDANGDAYGEGICTNGDGTVGETKTLIKGTWCKNRAHGYVCLIPICFQGSKYVGEKIKGKWTNK